MASKQRTVDYLLEQMSESQKVSARKMFGEYVCDERLFVKPTAGGRELIGEVTEGRPYPGAKPCLEIDGELWEDREWLSRLVKLTADELPPPKLKAPRAKAAPRPSRAKAAARPRSKR